MAENQTLELPSTEELIASAAALREELDRERLSTLASGVPVNARVVTTNDLPIPESTLRAAADAISRFTASPAGQKILALAQSGQGFEPDASFNDKVDALKAEVVAELQDALSASEFSAFWEALAAHEPRSGSEDAVVQSVSIGVGLIVGVGVVLQGTIGIAVDPRQLGNIKETVAFFTGALDVGGIVAEIEGIVLGLSRSPPSEMSGPSLNVAVSVDVGVGVTVEASFVRSTDHERLSGVSIGVGAGAGGEIAIGFSNTWIIAWDGKPRVYQPRADNYMMIQSIRCNKTGGPPGADDLYFTFTVDDQVTYRYPSHGQLAMNSGDTWNAGRSIYFNQKVDVRLFDQDDGGGDDPRGSHTYTTSGFDYSKDVGDNGGSYTINAVLNPQPLVWTDRQRINAVDSSVAAPALAVFGARLYCFWRAADSSQKIYMGYSTDGKVWTNGKRINEVDFTPDGPSAIAYGNQLFVFWRGGNDGAYWSTSDDGEGGTWGSGQRIGGASYGTASTPMPCVFKDTLYLFWNSTASSSNGNRIVFSAFNSSNRTWSTPAIINDRDGSSNRVAPCVFNNAVHLFFRNSGSGSDSAQIFHTYASSVASYTFGSASTINSGEKTRSGPAVNVAAGVHKGPEQLFVYFNSNDNAGNVIWTASASGSSWPQNTPISPYVATPIEFGTASFLHSQYLVWRSGDNVIYFCRSR